MHTCVCACVSIHKCVCTLYHYTYHYIEYIICIHTNVYKIYACVCYTIIHYIYIFMYTYHYNIYICHMRGAPGKRKICRTHTHTHTHKHTQTDTDTDTDTHRQRQRQRHTHTCKGEAPIISVIFRFGVPTSTNPCNPCNPSSNTIAEGAGFTLTTPAEHPSLKSLNVSLNAELNVSFNAELWALWGAPKKLALQLALEVEALSRSSMPATSPHPLSY